MFDMRNNILTFTPQHLVLEVPCPFRTPEMANVPGNTVNQSQLETLEIPGAHLVDHTQFACIIASYPKLRHLDISGTTIDGTQLYFYGDCCLSLMLRDQMMT